MASLPLVEIWREEKGRTGCGGERKKEKKKKKNERQKRRDEIREWLRQSLDREGDKEMEGKTKRGELGVAASILRLSLPLCL